MRIDAFAQTQTDHTIYVALAQISGALITLHDELNMYGDDEGTGTSTVSASPADAAPSDPKA